MFVIPFDVFGIIMAYRKISNKIPNVNNKRADLFDNGQYYAPVLFAFFLYVKSNKKRNINAHRRFFE